MKVAALTSSCLFLVNCSHNTGSNSAPAADASSAPVAKVYSVSKVSNFGISSDDNLIHLELDGIFSGTSDVVSVTCSAGAQPTVTVLSDSQTLIQMTISPVDDSCALSVQAPDASAAAAPSISLSSTQAAISIPSVSVSPSMSEASMFSVYLIGLNLDPSKAQIYESCDGADFTMQDESSVTLQTAFIPAMSFNISPPKNLSSCKFYLVYNGVQSAVIANYALRSTSLSSSTLTLNGVFSGSTDVVHLQCLNSAEQTFSGTDLLSDSATQIQLSVGSTVTSACTVYVTADGHQTKTLGLNEFLLF